MLDNLMDSLLDRLEDFLNRSVPIDLQYGISIPSPFVMIYLHAYNTPGPLPGDQSSHFEL